MMDSRVLGTRLAALWVGGAISVLAGCSENFGPPPPDGGSRVAVTAEAATGPARARAVLSVALSESHVWAGSDGGRFASQVESGAPTWMVDHAGYLGGDGFERTARVDALACDRSGRLILHLGRITPILALVTSVDGGQTHEALAVPDPVLQNVDEIGVFPPSPVWPAGAWVVRQGVSIFVRSVTGASWLEVELPGSPQIVRAVRPRSDGRLLVLVGSTGGDALWASSLTQPLRAVEVARSAVPLLDAAPDGDAWLLAHAAGVDRDSEPWLRWNGAVIDALRFDVAAGTPRWAALAGSTGGSWAIALGDGPLLTEPAATFFTGEPLLRSLVRAGGRAAFALRSSGEDRVVVVRGAGANVPALDARAARFTEADLRAITVLDPVPGVIAVGSEFGGEVFAGPSTDPEGFVQLGIGPLSSLITALVEDDAGRVVAGSFGIHRFDPDLQRWETSNNGQFTYQPGDFGGPVVVRSLARDPGGALWLGADNGDGVYRGTEVPGIGLWWERLHEGLGAPGSFETEFGLPFVTQVRGFAFDRDGRTWMGGFRGGAWILDSSTRTWSGANEGLPDVSGAVLDSCCATPGLREVDVRDIVSLDDGTLLAATAWGVFARGPGAGRWEERSLGLSNRDVLALAVHPQRAATVAAGTSTATGRDQWLFLTEDGGQTWFAVDVSVLARDCIDLVWSRPDRNELVALLRARGALRLELAP